MPATDFAIVGAGLAGCECALCLAGRGFTVTLYEQKPERLSPAHAARSLAELVCSNSLRSNDPASAVGMLKNEMRALGSAIIAAAEACSVPADMALAVDREAFSHCITERVKAEPNITLVCRHIESLDDPELGKNGRKGIVIAAGPLASEALSRSLMSLTGEEHCYFYDAIAPIVWTDSLDKNIVFRASRHSPGEEGDYLNAPMTRPEYEHFYKELCAGETFMARDFEKHFEGCMPVEALAQRGPKTLVFGPLKPIGLVDPRTGTRPWAVLQLRAEQREFTTANLVGCQTKLLYREQERIFRLVPGLERAEFVRHGSMHRNTYVNAPAVLNKELELRARPGVYLAGQITGVEGYVESAACGLWLGLALAAKASGRQLPHPPRETALGALLGHLDGQTGKFQPSNVNFGLMPAFDGKVHKKERKTLYAERGRKAFAEWLAAWH